MLLACSYSLAHGVKGVIPQDETCHPDASSRIRDLARHLRVCRRALDDVPLLSGMRCLRMSDIKGYNVGGSSGQFSLLPTIIAAVLALLFFIVLFYLRYHT